MTPVEDCPVGAIDVSTPPGRPAVIAIICPRTFPANGEKPVCSNRRAHRGGPVVGPYYTEEAALGKMPGEGEISGQDQNDGKIGIAHGVGFDIRLGATR